MPGPDRREGDAQGVLTWRDMVGYVTGAVDRVEAVTKRIESQLDRHEAYHKDDLSHQLNEARRAPGRTIMLVCTILAAVAAAFAIYATVHPHAPQIVVQLHNVPAGTASR